MTAGDDSDIDMIDELDVVQDELTEAALLDEHSKTMSVDNRSIFQIKQTIERAAEKVRDERKNEIKYDTKPKDAR